MHYDRPVRELLDECARSLQTPFTRAQILDWFQRNYPSVQPTTVSTHIAGLTEGARPHAHLAQYRPVLRRVGRGLYTRSSVGVSTAAPAFVRVEGQRPGAPLGEAALLLVGCVKTKLANPAPAKALYQSALLARRRAYAERTGRPWFVLSSRWGLVHPDEVIAPYDMYLGNQPMSYRRAWGCSSLSSSSRQPHLA